MVRGPLKGCATGGASTHAFPPLQAATVPSPGACAPWLVLSSFRCQCCVSLASFHLCSSDPQCETCGNDPSTCKKVKRRAACLRLGPNINFGLPGRNSLQVVLPIYCLTEPCMTHCSAAPATAWTARDHACPARTPWPTSAPRPAPSPARPPTSQHPTAL